MAKANTGEKRGGVRTWDAGEMDGHRFTDISNDTRGWDETNELWELCGERVREAKNKLRVL